MEKIAEYNGNKINYIIYKKKIKNMYIHVNEDKVYVSVPINTNDKIIDEFVNSKLKWIFNNLEKNKLIKKNNIENKNSIRIFSNWYKIQIEYTNSDINFKVDRKNMIVIIYLPILYKSENKEGLDNILNIVKQEIYKFMLSDIVKELIFKYEKLTGLHVNKCSLKFMKSAWGRCTSNRNISINTELAKYSKRAIESVVLHEMCHIKYMNHSKAYWQYLKSFMPDYDIVKEELNKKYI